MSTPDFSNVFFIGPVNHDLDNSCGYKSGISSEPRKNPLTFHYTGWLIGILIMVYYNPYTTG